MYLRNGIWYYDFILGGTRYTGTTGFLAKEKSKARAVEEAKRVEAREKKSILISWEQTKRKLSMFDKLELDVEKIWKEFSPYVNGKTKVKAYRRWIKRFCDWMLENYPDIKYIADIREQQAAKWYAYIRDKEGSSGLKNAEISIIKMVFRSIGKQFGVIENPFAEIKKLPNQFVERDAFTPEELSIIGREAKGWMFSLCLTALSTGLREGDICMLRKESVDLKSGWIHLKMRKTGGIVDIPIMPGLMNHLREIFSKNKTGEFVFPELAEKYQCKANSIGREVKDFFNSIGIKDATKQVDGYKKAVSVKDIHSFRHTFVYLAAINGVPFPIVQSIVGHASPEMTKHYMNHTKREEKQRYFSLLPEYLIGTAEKHSHVERKERLRRILNRVNTENLERTRQRILRLL